MRSDGNALLQDMYVPMYLGHSITQSFEDLVFIAHLVRLFFFRSATKVRIILLEKKRDKSRMENKRFCGKVSKSCGMSKTFCASLHNVVGRPRSFARGSHKVVGPSRRFAGLPQSCGTFPPFCMRLPQSCGTFPQNRRGRSGGQKGLLRLRTPVLKAFFQKK